MSRLRLTTLLLLTVAALPAAALASWHPGGGGRGYTKAQSLPGGSTPTTSVSGRNVTVNWTASSGGAPVSGYVVKRYNTGGTQQTINANCSGTIATTSCTEKKVPAGSWKYSVTPVSANWTGAESARSATATVGSPGFTLSGGSVTSLPATLSGQITNFIDGQAVTFRLDNQTSGTVLSGGIVPNPVPTNGTSNVSVTLPTGTANGSHTIYAIGDQGDVASASVTVAVPTTIKTTGWALGDASAGGAESDRSDQVAFAGDGRTYTTKSFSNAYGSSRYVDFDLNGPLQSGLNVSSVNFNFRFADSSAVRQGCFYFEVRKASNGNVLGTHGSTSSNVGCVTGTSQTTFTASLPEVTTSDQANDLLIRVYAKESGSSTALALDMATVTGTASGNSFTLYEDSRVDSANATALTTPWPLATAGDGATYQNASNWATTFSTARYLKLTFPGYVPSGAAVNSLSFKHSYRASVNGANACWYFEVYQGTTLLGTHGSSGSPVSCNSSTSTYVTDTVSLPEIDTAAEANGLSVRLYLRNSTGLSASQHDLARLQITYVP